MAELTHQVKVEGRVRFHSAQDAQRVAGFLLAGNTGTVFDHESQSKRIEVSGRSLRLIWEDRAAENDHEHTYMWLSQQIEHAEKGAFIVSGAEADTVFCLVEDNENDHLAKVIGALWAESFESEYLRDDFDCRDLPKMVALWRELDTWMAKSLAIMFIFDCIDVDHVPESVKEMLNDLWNMDEPEQLDGEAKSLEAEQEAYWYTQATAVDCFIPGSEGKVYHQIGNVLEGEARRAKFMESLTVARKRLNAQA